MDLKTGEIEKIIYGFLPKEEGYQSTVLSAMNYSVKAGGKRLRPLLMMETYRMLLDGPDDAGSNGLLHAFMAAMEMIHTYSLVHDDLPAMDNDMLRRGKPTTHAVYGEAMAILTGDALLNFAFETASKAVCEAAPDKVSAAAKALAVLSRKAGIYGMIGGQVADVEAEKKGESLEKDKLHFIYENKTGALIEASMMIGAILAGAGDDTISMVEKVASDLGLAFQIQDDILDIEGDEATLGKPIGSDEKNEKSTYVVHHGMAASKDKVKSLTESGIEILKALPGDSSYLVELMEYLVYREN